MFWRGNFLLLFITITVSNFAQSKFIAGLGYYENIYCGITNNLNRKVQLQVGTGLSPYVFSKNFQFSFHAAVGKKLWTLNKEKKLKLNYQLKATNWFTDNPYNRFVNLIVGPELSLIKQFKNNAALQISGGMGYNFVLFYKRKTNVEVGWPREIQPLISVQYVFK